MEHDQKLARPGEAHNEFVHLIWAESNQQFVYKCAESAQQIRGQEMTGIQWRSNDQVYQAEEAQNGFAHQIWGKSDQHFVCKYMENAWLIRGQKTMGIQWSMTKS